MMFTAPHRRRVALPSVFAAGVTAALTTSCVFTEAPRSYRCTEPADCSTPYEHVQSDETCSCVLVEGAVDAGTDAHDAGPLATDAGIAVDAGDGGTLEPDAGPPPDAGMTDAGPPPPDAGMPDAGQPDAGTPDAGPPPPTITHVVSGEGHTCALTSDGAVACVGDNRSGQCGNLTTSSAIQPVWVDLGGETAVQLVAGAAHTCAWTTSGAVWCWGSNVARQLGHTGGDSPNYASPPTRITPAQNIISLHAGGYNTCVRAQQNADTPVRLHCWGDNVSSQLAQDGGNTATPVQLPFADVRAVAIGAYFMCAEARKEDELDTAVWCWGTNLYGQRGTGTTEGQPSPSRVNAFRAPGTNEEIGLERVALAAGSNHVCAIHHVGEPDATWVCWGANSQKQVSQDVAQNVTQPTVMAAAGASDTLENLVQLSAGRVSTCASTSDGRVLCAGNNADGQLGFAPHGGTAAATTVPDPAGAGGLAIQPGSVAVGWQHACALDAVGALVCWGEQSRGRLGNGQSADSVHLPTHATVFEP